MDDYDDYDWSAFEVRELAYCEAAARLHADRPDVIADLRRRAAAIAGALAGAFGGRSQVSCEDVGRAVAGQIGNGGLTVHGTVEEVCVAVYDATLYGGDGHYPPDDPDYDTALPRVVGACLARLDATGGRPHLPRPLAHPDRAIGEAASY